MAKNKNYPPKRSPNPFILYRASIWTQIVTQNPGIKNGKISQLAAELWNEAPIEVKQEFERRSDVAKKEHASKYPKRNYIPRRMSSKIITRTKTETKGSEEDEEQNDHRRSSMGVQYDLVIDVLTPIAKLTTEQRGGYQQEEIVPSGEKIKTEQNGKKVIEFFPNKLYDETEPNTEDQKYSEETELVPQMMYEPFNCDELMLVENQQYPTRNIPDDQNELIKIVDWMVNLRSDRIQY